MVRLATIGLFICFALPMAAQRPWALEIGSALPQSDLRQRVEADKTGGLLGLTYQVHRFEANSWFGEGYALRLRADALAFPNRTAPSVEMRAAHGSLDLLHTFGSEGRGFQLIAGLGGAAWQERLEGGRRSTIRWSDTLGLGWQWKRFGVELRYTSSSLDAHRSANSVECVWSVRF